MGVIFALLALLSWGCGDFLIQKSARKFGDAIALFFICALAALALLPFVIRELIGIISQHYLAGVAILVLATFLTLFAALFDFEALRIGKISVIEPIYSFEIIVTAALSTVLIREHLTAVQIFLIAALFLGIFWVSLRSLEHLKEFKWEKGVVYAILATAAMGGVNFLFGVGARDTSPLLINWFTSTGIAFILLVYLLAKRQSHTLARDLEQHKGLAISVAVIDNMAWIFFSYATLYIPIAIATGISESYIAMAAGLGIIFNREKLKFHQGVGLVICLAAAVLLSFTIK